MRNSRLLIALLLLVMTAIAYGNSFFSDFVGDDAGRILSKESYYQQGYGAVFRYIMMDRPFLTFTIWLNYYFGGMNTFGYKLVNVLLHAGCAVAVFELMRELFRKLENPARLAFYAAGIFAVHPINNQAVLSVIQRGVLLATLFSLLAYLFLLKNIRSGKSPYLYFSILLFALALLSKPNVLMFPFLFVLLLVQFEGFTAKNAFKKCAPYFLLLALPLIQYLFSTRSQANAIPAFQYFLVQTQVIFFYFSKYFFPVNLQFIYAFDNFPADLLAFDDYRYLAGHAVVLFVALWTALRKQSVMAWLVLLGYISFLPESGFFSILHVAFDHRNYIPIIFFAAAFVVAVQRLRVVSFVMAPAIVTLGALNFGYTAKISTYDNWVNYNLTANPGNRSSYIYQLAKSVEADNAERTEKILQLIGPAAQQDHEAVMLKSFLGYSQKTAPQKKEFIQGAMSFALDNQISVHYFYFFEDFIRRELPLLYEPELVVFALNSFYFGYLDYWQKYLSAPELFDRIRENFTQAAHLAETRSSPLEKMIAVRSRVALYRYFAEPLPRPAAFYLELLSGELAGLPEAETLKGWLKL